MPTPQLCPPPIDQSVRSSARLEDLALALRIAAGDPEVTERFVREHQPWITDQARSLRIPINDLEDVVQNVLFAAIDQLRRGLYRGDSSIKTWLRRIIQGKVADYFASQDISATALVPIQGDGMNDEVSPLDRLLAPEFDHDAVIGVRCALKALPAECRVILVLNRVMGYTIEEISQAMEKSASLIARRLYKAEGLFSQLIGGEFRLICGKLFLPPCEGQGMKRQPAKKKRAPPKVKPANSRRSV